MIGYGSSGSTHDFFAFDGAGLVWDTTANLGAGGFVAWVDANYANYRITATQTGTSGRFSATAPAGTVTYELRVRGATLADSPSVWTGGDDATANVTRVSGQAMAPDAASQAGYFQAVPVNGAGASLVHASETRVMAQVTGMDANVLTAAVVSADAVAEIQNGGGTAQEVWEYASRTLTHGVVRVTNPWQQGALSILKGDTYTGSKKIQITKSADWAWPSDLDATYAITFTATPTQRTLVDDAAAATLTNTGNVVNATTVDLGDLSAAETATLAKPRGDGTNAYTYKVTATKAGELWTLETGVLSVG